MHQRVGAGGRALFVVDQIKGVIRRRVGERFSLCGVAEEVQGRVWPYEQSEALQDRTHEPSVCTTIHLPGLEDNHLANGRASCRRDTHDTHDPPARAGGVGAGTVLNGPTSSSITNRGQAGQARARLISKKLDLSPECRSQWYQSVWCASPTGPIPYGMEDKLSKIETNLSEPNTGTMVSVIAASLL